MKQNQSTPRARDAHRFGTPLARRAVRAAAIEVLEERRLLSAFTVSSALDSGTGTLREAITLANANADADTINFAAGLSGGTIELTSGELAITADVAITGPAAGVSVVRSSLSGTADFRIFSVAASTTVSIDNLTISNGVATEGAGIRNAGTLTVTDCTITQNAGVNRGGGIYNVGTLNVITCDISYNDLTNTSSGAGAGVASSSVGVLTITGSTISHNTTNAGLGGGIRNDGSGSISDSTISNNLAAGGGLWNNDAGTLTLTNCTFSENSGGSGSAIFNRGTLTGLNLTIANNASSDNAVLGQSSSTSTYNNCIFANTTGGGTNLLLGGTSSGSYNLVTDASVPASFTNAVTGDPVLGILQNNGGPTFTFALGSSSAARNAGNSALIPGSVLYDQRGVGFDRKVGVVDVGAFEVQNPVPTANAGGPYNVAEGSSVTLDGSGSSDPEQAANTLTYEWDFDGDTQYDDATGINPSFSAALLDGPTVRTVGLRVTNTSGESSTATASVNVSNAAPAAIINGAPATSSVNVPINLTGSFTDPSPLDTISSWAWTVLRDGQAFTSGSTQNFSFTPTSTGVYSVSLIVTDDNGAASMAATKSISVSGAVLIADPQLAGKTALLVSGSTLDDVIVVDGANGKVTVTLNGNSIGSFKPTGRVIVLGGSGQDTISATGQISVPVMLYGEAGNDSLNGGSGAAILVGGDGNDQLISDGGADLLLGGDGQDNLNGGKGEDILIGGITSYDAATTANFQSLCFIQDEWLTNQTYARRTGHIAGTLSGGKNGANVFNTTTIFDDGDADVITGGLGQDWYFGRKPIDTIDNVAGELLVTV